MTARVGNNNVFNYHRQPISKTIEGNHVLWINFNRNRYPEMLTRISTNSRYLPHITNVNKTLKNIQQILHGRVHQHEYMKNNNSRDSTKRKTNANHEKQIMFWKRIRVAFTNKKYKNMYNRNMAQTKQRYKNLYTRNMAQYLKHNEETLASAVSYALAKKKRNAAASAARRRGPVTRSGANANRWRKNTPSNVYVPPHLRPKTNASKK